MPRVVEMTEQEVLALPVIVSLETAGRALGMGRNKAYRLHRDGQFPIAVREIGDQEKCTRADILAYLGISADSPAAAPAVATSPAA